MNQSAELLELFLQEENHILSVNAIGESLWDTDGNYENRVYPVSVIMPQICIGNIRMN